jgi:hypothetical protein
MISDELPNARPVNAWEPRETNKELLLVYMALNEGDKQGWSVEMKFRFVLFSTHILRVVSAFPVQILFRRALMKVRRVAMRANEKTQFPPTNTHKRQAMPSTWAPTPSYQPPTNPFFS